MVARRSIHRRRAARRRRSLRDGRSWRSRGNRQPLREVRGPPARCLELRVNARRITAPAHSGRMVVRPSTEHVAFTGVSQDGAAHPLSCSADDVRRMCGLTSVSAASRGRRASPRNARRPPGDHVRWCCLADSDAHVVRPLLVLYSQNRRTPGSQGSGVVVFGQTARLSPGCGVRPVSGVT